MIKATEAHVHSFTRYVNQERSLSSTIRTGVTLGVAVAQFATGKVQKNLKRLPNSDTDLLTEIAPDVERLFNRHLEAPRLWFPHEQIDWGQGENFADHPWSAENYPLAPGVRSSIYVNLLTEDNLPYYTS